MITGSSGIDIFAVSTSGTDTFDGGAGSSDLISLDNATSGATLTLVQSSSATSVGAGNAAAFSYSNMEGVIGSTPAII